MSGTTTSTPTVTVDKASAAGRGPAIFAAGPFEPGTVVTVDVRNAYGELWDRRLFTWQAFNNGRRYVARCKNCKARLATTRPHQWGNSPVEFCPNPECRRLVAVQPVDGTYNPEKVCNAKCVSATGPRCECSCAGERHGAGHTVGW